MAIPLAKLQSYAMTNDKTQMSNKAQNPKDKTVLKFEN
jgi:hypothetical protein